MKLHSISELSAFVLALLIATGTMVLAIQFPRAEDAHSGPGSFPLFLGLILAGLSVSGIILSLREGCPPDSRGHPVSARKRGYTVAQPEAGPPMGSSPETLARSSQRINMLMLAFATALYLLAMPLLGFISGTALFCMGTLMILGYRNPVRALAAGFVTAFALYGIFGVLMNVVLPKGWIG